MRILLHGRSNLFDKFGGDTSQIVQLADWLRHSGQTVSVEARLEPPLEGYDLVHIFGIMRPDEAFVQWRAAAKRRIPTVLGPCFQDLALYNREGRFGLSRFVCRALAYRHDRIAYVRNLLLACMSPRARKSLKLQRHMGMERQVKEILDGVTGILFSSKAEQEAVYGRFGSGFGVMNAIVPNGIAAWEKPDHGIFQEQFSLKDYILCSGRIEDLKNQLALLRAVRTLRTPVVLAGAFNKAHRAYRRAIEASLRRNGNFYHVGFLQREMLGSCYRAARAHAQPSWFENVGLSTLEALSCGVPCVMTSSGYGGEYFGDSVQYCDPSSEESIRIAVMRALDQGGGRTPHLQEVASAYTWDRVGPKYIEFYETVLAAGGAL